MHAAGRSMRNPFPRRHGSRSGHPGSTKSGPRVGLTSGSPPDCGGRSGTSGGSRLPTTSVWKRNLPVSSPESGERGNEELGRGRVTLCALGEVRETMANRTRGPLPSRVAGLCVRRTTRTRPPCVRAAAHQAVTARGHRRCRRDPNRTSALAWYGVSRASFSSGSCRPRSTMRPMDPASRCFRDTGDAGSSPRSLWHRQSGRCRQ